VHTTYVPCSVGSYNFLLIIILSARRNFSEAATSSLPAQFCIITLPTGAACTSDELSNLSTPILPEPTSLPSRKRRADNFDERSDSKRSRSSVAPPNPIPELFDVFPAGLVQLESLDHLIGTATPSSGMGVTDIYAWQSSLNLFDGPSASTFIFNHRTDSEAYRLLT
jgi:hypothetical protein